MKLLYLLVAEDFILDQFQNAVTAVKIVERLALRESGRVFTGSRGFDWRSFRFFALTVFEAESDEETQGEFSVVLRTPVREVEMGRRPCDFSATRVSRSRLEFPGVPNDGPGEYAILVQHSEGARAEWVFNVRIVAPIAAEGATSDAVPLRRTSNPRKAEPSSGDSE